MLLPKFSPPLTSSIIPHSWEDKTKHAFPTSISSFGSCWVCLLGSDLRKALMPFDFFPYILKRCLTAIIVFLFFASLVGSFSHRLIFSYATIPLFFFFPFASSKPTHLFALLFSPFLLSNLPGFKFKPPISNAFPAQFSQNFNSSPIHPSISPHSSSSKLPFSFQQEVPN